MRRSTLCLCLTLIGPPLLAQGLPPTAPGRVGLDSARLARIGVVMQAAVDSGRTAGVVVMVARHGRQAYAGAWGWADREAKRRMTVSSLFRIASQTKAVTSVAAMMLVEDGLLRLDDPVAKFLPGFGEAKVATATDTGIALVPVRRPITIHDLLTHTAGISYGTDSSVRDRYAAQGLGPRAGPFGWYLADKAEPICASMDRLGGLPIVAQPGSRFVYGYNTDLLGCIVEKVSGLTLASFFDSRIFRPLGMTSTWFFPPAAARDRLAAVYAWTDHGLERAPDGPPGQGDYLDGPKASYSGGAGLVSSAGDYARFLQMLANGGSLNGHRILGPRTVALMTTDHVDSLYGGGLGFGLGFEVLEDPGRAAQFGNPGRFGWGGAYATVYWVDPKDELVVVFMTQLLPAGRFDLADRLRALVYQAIR